MSPLVGFCGLRSFPASASPLAARVVGSVLASGRDIAVGCSVGADALVVSSVLAAGEVPRLSVLCAFGPVFPSWPTPRVSASSASRFATSVSGVAEALAAGASVRW